MTPVCYQPMCWCVPEGSTRIGTESHSRMHGHTTHRPLYYSAIEDASLLVCRAYYHGYPMYRILIYIRGIIYLTMLKHIKYTIFNVGI